MNFTKLFGLGSITLALALSLNSVSLADSINNEIDLIRAELATIKDKNSPLYQKNKQKLEKYIVKNKIDYSNETRFSEVSRLIYEQKYNSAIYELNELIEAGFEVGKCNELLGDIAQKCENSPKKIAQYYKLAFQHDCENAGVSYKLAKLYFREKKNIIAIEYLKQTIKNTQDCDLLEEVKDIILNKIKPQSRFEANNLYEALGEIYAKLGEKENSYEAFSKALAINTNDIYLKYYLSGLLFEDNQFEHAINLFDSILEQNPKDTQIKILKAKSLARSGDVVSANQLYLAILSEYPTSKQARYGIYQIYQNENPFEILKKVYPQKKNFNPNLKDINQFAKFLYEMEDINGAQNFANFAKNLEEQEKQKQLALLKEQEFKKAQIEKAKQEKLTQERLKQEKIKKEKENKAKILEEQKAKKRAQEELKAKQKEKELENAKKIKLEKEQKAKLKKEQELKLEKEKQQKELEKKAIQEEQQKAKAKDIKKYNELKAVADGYLSKEPKTAQNLIAAANTFKQMGEVTNAIKYYKEAMKLEPANSDIYYNLGLAYLEQNKDGEAKNNLIKAINLDEENAKAVNLLAFVNQKIITKNINQAFDLYEKKDYISSFEILDKGIKEYPQNAQLRYYRALVYEAMNRNAAAIIDLQKAIEFDPAHYMSYYQLGKLYEKIKDERSALVAYEKFLSIEPDEKELIDEIQKKVVNLGSKYY